MANEEHLAILNQGVEVWNQWREENHEVKPDLSVADLSGADLSATYLSYPGLSSVGVIYFIVADLSDADLSDADLSSANLSQANLGQAFLNNADLRNANLSSANLSQAFLNNADLHNANLSQARLSQARLSSANLSQAFLSDANLSDADLSSADLRQAYLRSANLSQANLRYAKIGWTVFGNVDLSEVKGLDTIEHHGPSSIGIDTIYQSKGNIPYKFLFDAGVPKDDIPYLLSLAGKAIDFYSCFISYSSQDQAFAERLHADLQAKGVRTWYAPEDLKIGEVMLSGIDKGIQLHDKLLVVLSEHSVTSKWVEHEVEAALYEESQPERKTQVLFPIRLDDTVIATKVNWAYRIRQRHIGDFTQWKDHDAYQKAFDRLLRDLKMEAQP